MPSSLADFIIRLAQSRKDLNNITSPQLHSQQRREELRKLVEDYFNTIRPSLIEASAQDPDVNDVDELMQELIELCHKHGSVKRYKNLLSNTRKGLIKLDARIVSIPSTTGSQPLSNGLDNMIIGTLEKIVPAAALSYRQALIDLEADHRFSWRGPATDLREALRETLDYLAPDAEVIALPGYKQNPDINGPTMKQKVWFIMKNRGAAKALSAPAETATESIESAVGSFVRSVYTRSSVSTHTPTDKNEVVRIREFVRVVLSELLEIRL